MFILGLNGSPRRKGNTDYLLSRFMETARDRGCEVHTLDAAFASYKPCIGCGYCDTHGTCSIKDGLEVELFPLIRRCDVMILAAPIYFYAFPARIKGVIDRIQTLWSRKYRLKIIDPAETYRKGVLFGVAATQGKNLFDGMRLTARYFFDAAGADFSHELCFRGVDARGDLASRDGVDKDIALLADQLIDPLAGRKRILFACRENAGRSQMAAAFARHMAGDRLEVLSGGSDPVDAVNPVVVDAMAKEGLDIAFHFPCSMTDALAGQSLDVMVTMGCGEACPFIPGCRQVDWDLEDPAGRPMETVARIRDEIREKVAALIKEL